MPFFGFGRKKKKDDEDFVSTKRSEGKLSQEDEEIEGNVCRRLLFRTTDSRFTQRLKSSAGIESR